jgi:hypothetical protein
VKALIAAGANLSARDAVKSTAFGIALGSPLGFKERSLRIAQALAAAMPEGAVRDELRERLEDQQIGLLKIRNAAVGALNELVTKMKEVGIAGLDDEQRGKLKKMLETGQAIETEATALQASGDQLLKSLTDDLRSALAAAFQYADEHQSLTFEGQFLGLDTVVFLHQL